MVRMYETQIAKKLLTELRVFSGLNFYYLSLFDRIAATSHMKEFGLDYDDACHNRP